MILNLLVSALFAQQMELPFPVQPCMSKEVAAKLIWNEVTKVNGPYCVMQDWDDDRTEWPEGSCHTKADLNKGLSNLRWDNKFQRYESGVVWNYYCAAGAECWGGYMVDCKGEVDRWEDGED